MLTDFKTFPHVADKSISRMPIVEHFRRIIMLFSFSRRHFLTMSAMTLGALAVSGLSRQAHAAPASTLIVYFSWSGNTRGIARLLHQKIGGDLVELELVTP